MTSYRALASAESEMLQCTVLIAVGANIPDHTGRAPIDTCRWATGQVVVRSGLRLTGQSPWYQSTPVPPSGQPDYINGVIRLSQPVSLALDPHHLLLLLHEIEAEAGRVRTVLNAARTLDLDLLAVGALVLDGPGLVLPHPRMHERGFVLHPLRDVAADWVHPIHGSVGTMLALIDDAGLSPLATPDLAKPS